MYLVWNELTDEGIVTKKNTSSEVNINNCAQYARKNCRHCNGRGYIELSLGKGYSFVEESLRTQTCWCVDRHLEKLRNINESI